MKKVVTGSLILSVISGIIVRIVPYWSTIFNGEHINFASPDAYYQIDLVTKQYLSMGHIMDGASFYHWLLAGVSWILSFGHGDIHFVETVSAFTPILFFVLTATIIFSIGKALGSVKVGLIAVIVFSLLPGECLTRSVLGEIDYHVFEVFITSSIILIIIKAPFFPQTEVDFVEFWISVVGLFFVYFTVWRGAPLFLPILAAFVIPYRKKTGFILVGLSCVVLVLAYFKSGMSDMIIQNTSESQPGFTAPFPLLHVIITAGMLFFVKSHKYQWPLIIWAVLLIGAALFQLRFDYYLIIPLALLAGIAVDKLWCRVKKPVLVSILAGVLFILCLPGYILLPKLYIPSPAVYESLEWIKENTSPDSIIVSWWDYGYWIRYIGQREEYANPGQGNITVKGVADWLTKGTPPGSLTGKRVYLYLDKNTFTEFSPAITAWANSDSNYMSELYYSLVDLKDYNLVYYKGDIKIYEVEL